MEGHPKKCNGYTFFAVTERDPATTTLQGKMARNMLEWGGDGMFVTSNRRHKCPKYSSQQQLVTNKNVSDRNTLSNQQFINKIDKHYYICNKSQSCFFEMSLSFCKKKLYAQQQTFRFLFNSCLIWRKRMLTTVVTDGDWHGKQWRRLLALKFQTLPVSLPFRTNTRLFFVPRECAGYLTSGRTHCAIVIPVRWGQVGPDRLPLSRTENRCFPLIGPSRDFSVFAPSLQPDL